MRDNRPEMRRVAALPSDKLCAVLSPRRLIMNLVDFDLQVGGRGQVERDLRARSSPTAPGGRRPPSAVDFVRSRFGCLFALALFAGGTLGLGAGPRPAEAYRSLTDDGGWCWFADPRAITRGGRTYAGWITADGSVQVGMLEAASGKVSVATLHEKYQRDDHDVPALFFLNDGRLLALYSKHGGPDMNARVTTRPGDITAWEPERVLDLFGGPRPRRSITYPNPVRLTAEANAIYLFWRGDAIKPTFSRSTDDGLTWSPARELVARRENAERNRPYVKIASNGRDRIHIAFTDGHPNIEPTNGLYYLCYRAGALSSAAGHRIGGLEQTPLQPSQAERVYDGQAGGRAWVWDVAADAQDRPVIVYVRIPDTGDHRYRYARWDGARWQDHEICAGGKWFPQTPPGVTEREPFYSGGLVLDHTDPSVVYLSRPVNGVREIERWTTADGGRTWRNEPITRGSAHDNVRPFVVRREGPGGPTVLWMNLRDHYTHFTDYLGAIKMDSP